MRNLYLVAAAFALVLVSPDASGARLARAEQKRIVRTCERVPANIVDPELPAIGLAAWIRQTLGPEAEITWDISDCDLQPDFSQPAETYPLCVGVRARTASRVWLKLHFAVGTLGKYDATRPSLERQSFMVRGNILNGCIGELDRLSSLPKEISRLVSMLGCSKQAPPN